MVSCERSAFISHALSMCGNVTLCVASAFERRTLSCYGAIITDIYIVQLGVGKWERG